MVDSSENILVDFDFNNITIIDPNKVIDEFGKAKERLVKHEDLVMYANLECKVLPRTKLLIGASNADNLRTISSTDINFLNPGNKTYMDTKWTDEITGKDTQSGQGVNQRKLGIQSVVKPDKTNKFYYSQSTLSYVDGESKATSVDNGMLGIKTIQIKYGTEFMPVITMKLEDVKGRTLFEAGNDSPYAAFFNLPYPLFNLTIKGYYGKAVKLPLMLQDFTCAYNPATSNFDIDLKFVTYKYTLLSEVNFGSLLAVPYMYTKNVQKTQQTNQGNNTSEVKTQEVYYGYQKIKEVYSEYKSKGLIPKDFPELTVQQLKYNLDQFIKNVLDGFIKQNLDPITNIQEYIDNVKEYQNQVYYYTSGAQKSWHNTYNDKKVVFVQKLSNGGTRKLFPFNAETLINNATKITAEDDLKVKKIEYWNGILAKNKTLGKNGSYTISGNKINSEIQNTITFNDFYIDFDALTENDIDFEESFKLISGATPTNSQKDALIKEFKRYQGSSFNSQNNTSKIWFFEGIGSFIEKTDKMVKEAELKKDEVGQNLSKALAEILKSDKNSLGFIPTIRNVTAVLFASAEAYLRLLDDVHVKAWSKRDSPIRKKAIDSVNTKGASENITSVQKQNVKIPIYPWPEFLIETSGENGQEKFQPRYLNDESVRAQTRADVWEEWPEVEFVEEYVNGFAKRNSNIQPTAATNQALDSSRLSVNAIEFPANNEIFNNLEEVKYFYEIYERILLSSYYSKFVRSTLDNGDLDKIAVAISESEKLNILNSLTDEAYFLRYKLKNYNFNQANFVPTLRHFSNEGVGLSWQNFERGIFNTNYLKNLSSNSRFSIFYEHYNPQNVLGKNINAYNVSTLVSFDEEKDIVKFLTGSTSGKKFDLTDLYPFTNEDWCRTNLPGLNPIPPASVNYVNIPNNSSSTAEFYDTSKNLFYNTIYKTVTNYNDTGDMPRPISNYNFYNQQLNVLNPNNTTSFVNNLGFLDKFYKERSEKYSKQFPTEGNLNYETRPGILTEKQTVSIFNTPFFINSVQKGVQKFRNYDKYPYLVPAYLFINSLPLATLREKFTKFSQTTPNNSTQPIESIEQMNYIFPTFRKFGAIHKLPLAWILKIGSIWYRYKTWVNTGVDILDECWTDFNPIVNFDPNTSAATKTYSLTLSGNQNVDITLEKETPVGTQIYTQINTGFYPQLINDFNVFLQGLNIINPYTSVEGVAIISGGTMVVNSVNGILTIGSYLKGLNVIGGTQIAAQLSGPTGGVGIYLLNISGQTAGNTNFVATNFAFPGYNSTVVQDALDNNGLVLLNSPNSNYTMNFSGDPSNLNRYIQMNAWSVFAKDRNGVDCYLLPSHGALLNQAALECFENNKKKFEVSGNTSVYNGSVRTFWNAPNYGFFDVDKILKPKPDEYLKTVFGGFIQQENFSLNSNSNKYTKMSEILTAFDKDVLDEFENLFLTFSKDKYDYEKRNKEATAFESTCSNFHAFYCDLMRVSLPTGTTSTDIIFELQEKQTTNLVGKIKEFMNYFVYFKYGNPSNYDKLNFETFSNRILQSDFQYERYSVTTRNALPDGVNGQTLVNSKIEYDEEWKTLLTYVGFSEIPGIRYTDNGSTIFDFFIDFDVAFNKQNIILYSQLIKMYATQKKRNSNVNGAVFAGYMDKYLNDGELLINKVIDNLFIKLQKEIQAPQITNVRQIQQTGQGEQTKLELYQLFKATNDKWISGTDLKNKTLFEDVMFLDRANKDLGQRVVVDIVSLSEYIDPELTKSNSNFLDVVDSVIKRNKFEPFYIPAFVNFYGVNEVSANAIPNPEGTLELANTLFGTFTNVDYRESSTKMVNYYGGPASKHLDKEDLLEGYKNDSFDLRRAADNPLIENQVNKKDWATSNKVVGFNIDVGPQNQGVFKSFSVSQKNSTPTAESLQIISEMARQAGNRGYATQNISLYDLYKIRSYTCDVSMLGCALIQPLMYFNLRYIPMFSGPYMITEVSHSISIGEFNTTFKGVRQPVASFASDVDLLQSLKTNLIDVAIQNRLEKDKAEKQKKAEELNLIKKKNNAVSKATQTLSSDAAMTCTANTKYKTFNIITNVSVYDNVSTAEIVNKIETIGTRLNFTGDLYNKMKYSIFAKIWLENNGKLLSQNAKGIERNFIGTELTKNWYAIGDKFFDTKFFCAQRNSLDGPKPYAVFKSMDDNIEFLYSIWAGLVQKIKNVNKNDEIATLILTDNFDTKTWKAIDKTTQDKILLEIENSKKVFDDNDSI